MMRIEQAKGGNMKKQAAIKCFLVSLSLVLLVSCGNTSSTGTENTNSQAKENISSSQAVEQKVEKKEEVYEKFRKAEKENVIGDEEQQLVELSEALEKLQLEYAKDEEIGDVLAITSPYCNKNEESGQSCVAPFIYIFGPSVDPMLGIGFMYIDSQYLGVDTVEIDTDEHRYTYNSDTFLDIVKNKTVINSENVEKSEEMAIRIAVDQDDLEKDIDVLIDMLESDAVSLRFGKYNMAKPDLVECPMPENDKQAIVDVLNAYYLYLNTTQAVRARALAELT
jgi:hypothetical protein